MVWAFFYGFVTAFGVMAGFIFWAGRNTRPLLAARLLALENERKTTLAKAVKAAASVDKFKVSTIGAVTISATPAHIQTSGMQFRLTMIGSAITVTAVANAPNVNATASAATSAAAAKLLTADKVIATLNAKAIKVQRVNRNALLLLPAEGQDGLCEVDDRGLGETQERRVKWRALTLTFKGGAREAERWYSVLSPTPATQRWINFVQSVPQGCDSSLNFLVARILFENSGDSTLNTFIGAKIRKKLSHVKLPKPLSGSIELIDVSFGDEAPFFTNSAFSGSSSTGEFGFDFDLLYRGGFTVVLSATVDIGPLKIPNVILTVKILEIKGKMHMSIGAPPSKDMWLGFHQRPEIKINIHQDIHVPPEVEFLAASVRSIDLSSVVSDLVTMNLFDDMILPQMDDIPIPNVGPTPPSTPVVGPTAIKDPVLFEPALPPHAPAQPMLLSKSPAKPPSDLITRIISETESSAKPTSLAIRGAGNAAVPLPPPQPLPPAAPMEEPEVKAAAVNKAAEEAKRKTEAILQQSKASSVAAVEKKTPPVAATSPVEPTFAATTAPTPPPPVPPQRLSPQDDTWDYASDAEATKTTPHNQQSPAVVGQVPPAEVPAPAPVPAAPPQNQQPAAPQQPQPYVVDTSMYGRRYVQSQPQW